VLQRIRGVTIMRYILEADRHGGRACLRVKVFLSF